MKRALYLDGGAGPLTVTADGPALRIRRPGSADGRAPLRLISRIVVRGKVAWQTEALVACMDADVPVAFVTGDGGARGWCLGARGAADDINTLLDDCALRRDWPGQHQDWLRAMERREMILALRPVQPVPEALRSSDLWVACEVRLDRLRAPVGTALILGTAWRAPCRWSCHLDTKIPRSGRPLVPMAGHSRPRTFLIVCAGIGGYRYR